MRKTGFWPKPHLRKFPGGDEIIRETGESPACPFPGAFTIGEAGRNGSPDQLQHQHQRTFVLPPASQAEGRKSFVLRVWDIRCRSAKKPRERQRVCRNREAGREGAARGAPLPADRKCLPGLAKRMGREHCRPSFRMHRAAFPRQARLSGDREADDAPEKMNLNRCGERAGAAGGFRNERI